MNEDVYKTIAERNNTTVEEVKKEMQKALDSAFSDSNQLINQIPFKGEKPTIDEFINFVANMLIDDFKK